MRLRDLDEDVVIKIHTILYIKRGMPIKVEHTALSIDDPEENKVLIVKYRRPYYIILSKEWLYLTVHEMIGKIMDTGEEKKLYRAELHYPNKVISIYFDQDLDIVAVDED
jgi:hypothetical protein